MRTESNTAWYKWTAADNGTLTFNITPSKNTDDIDWVLYDLGPEGTCENILPANILRCAAGSGVSCTPRYFITGLNLTSTDLQEENGCVAGQDGFVKYIDMIAGHNYALLVDNFSSENNGFSISFGGTGNFSGPAATFSYTEQNSCTNQQSYTFNSPATGDLVLNWSFGEGANLSSSATAGPHEIKYSSSGYKTVVLEVTNNRGCTSVSSQTFYVALKPELPVITANKPDFCLLDTIKLAIPEVPDALYHWTGPDNFTATTAAIAIPIKNFDVAGDYQVTMQLGNCISDVASINVPPIARNPIAAFTTDLVLPGKYARPLPIQFMNQSKDAAVYVWNFGDGNSSDEVNPKHIFDKAGRFTITLTALTVNGCTHSVSLANLMILEQGTLLVPNSFSPNDDNINDEFNINVANLKQFKISIYNRYGEQLFESNDIFNSWKGTYRNQPVPIGAYFYIIKAQDLSGKDIKLSGSITLIR